MELTIISVDRTLTTHLLKLNEAFQECFIFNEVVGSRGLVKPQTTQAITKAICCSPQNDGKALLLKTVCIQLNGHGKVDLVPI